MPIAPSPGLSIFHIVTVLCGQMLNVNPVQLKTPRRDRFFNAGVAEQV